MPSVTRLAAENLVAHFPSGADLTVHSTGTDLSGDEGLTQEQTDAAEGDAETKLPKGLIRPARWTKP